MKYNQEAASEYLGVNNDVVKEYFEKMDDNIKYYIQRCLEYLQSADVLKWYKVPMVRKKNKETFINSNGNIMIKCSYEDLRATPEEVSYFNTVFEDLRNEMNIKSKSECFYGSKALNFCKSLSENIFRQASEWLSAAFLIILDVERSEIRRSTNSRPQ
jgi:hypothetical protein